MLVGLALLGLVLWFVCGALVLFADSAVLSLGMVGFVQGVLRQLLGAGLALLAVGVCLRFLRKPGATGKRVLACAAVIC